MCAFQELKGRRKEFGLKMKTCVVIINPSSGKGLGIKNKSKIENILDNYNYESEFIITKYRGHATKIVEKLEPVDLVLSVGGDGTFSEAMNGNLKRKKRLVLAHLPVGTTNDIGYMYGLGNNLLTNLKLILEGSIQKIDIGLINNHAFTYVASYGKFMDIPYKTPQDLKRKIGYLAYLFEGIKQIFRYVPKCKINFYIDGEKHTGKYTFIIVSNANRIAGINNFYNDIKLNDNKFEVMFCSLHKKIDILKAFYILKTSDVKYISGVEIYKTDNLKIEILDDYKSWCVDGEEFSDTKNCFEFKLINDVSILIPDKNIEKLFIKK